MAIDGDVAGNASPAGWFINSGTSHVGSVTQQTLSHPSGESNNAFGRSLRLSNGNGNGNVILSWPATPGWSLWQSPSRGTSSWNPVTVVTDGTHTHPVSAAPRMFFRLQN